MTSPLESRLAGAVQVGEVVNGLRVVGVQNDSDVTLIFEDGTTVDYPFDTQIPYQ